MQLISVNLAICHISGKIETCVKGTPQILHPCEAYASTSPVETDIRTIVSNNTAPVAEVFQKLSPARQVCGSLGFVRRQSTKMFCPLQRDFREAYTFGLKCAAPKEGK